MLFSLLSDFQLDPHKLFRFRRPDVGAKPGTLSLPKDGQPTQWQVHSYNRDSILCELDKTKDYLAQSDRVHWFDVCGLSTAATIRAVAKLAEIPDLMLEDMVNIPQRCGVNVLDDRLLIVTRMIHPHENGHLVVEQASIYVYKNIVVTFQEDSIDPFDPIRQRLQNPKGPLRNSPAWFLAYTLLDVIIDAYFPVLEQLANRVQLLEHLALTRPSPGLLNHLMATRNEVIQVHRAVHPQKDLLHQLIREHGPFKDPVISQHFKDTHDHTIQAAETTGLLSEMSSTLLNLYMSAMANRTNDKMKVLTVMASIFIPLTFLAGVYGMNFSDMPELRSRWGYPLTLLLMFAIAVGLLGYFYRIGWLVDRDHDLAKILHEQTEDQ